MNWKRIAIGGVAAGILLVVIDFAGYGIVFMKRYEDLAAAGVFLKDPRLPFMVVWPLILLAEGFGLAWAYAVARPRLGPGPMTALWVGLGTAFFAHVPPNVAAASWGMQGRFIPLMQLILGAVGIVAGAQLAAWLYQEEEAKAA